MSLVEKMGVEPTTSWLPVKCSSQLSYIPEDRKYSTSSEFSLLELLTINKQSVTMSATINAIVKLNYPTVNRVFQMICKRIDELIFN